LSNYSTNPAGGRTATRRPVPGAQQRASAVALASGVKLTELPAQTPAASAPEEIDFDENLEPIVPEPYVSASSAPQIDSAQTAVRYGHRIPVRNRYEETAEGVTGQQLDQMFDEAFDQTGAGTGQAAPAQDPAAFWDEVQESDFQPSAQAPQDKAAAKTPAGVESAFMVNQEDPGKPQIPKTGLSTSDTAQLDDAAVGDYIGAADSGGIFHPEELAQLAESLRAAQALSYDFMDYQNARILLEEGASRAHLRGQDALSQAYRNALELLSIQQQQARALEKQQALSPQASDAPPDEQALLEEQARIERYAQMDLQKQQWHIDNMEKTAQAVLLPVPQTPQEAAQQMET
jgi:hypothetical protein